MTFPDWLGFFIDPVLFNRYLPRLVDGFFTTIQLVGIAYSLGFLLALGIVKAYLSSNMIARSSARAFIYFFRGSPLMVQLFLFYYGLGSLSDLWHSLNLWWFFQNAWYCCIAVFSLNSAAYQAEILRGSFASVPQGQYEACHALNLTRSTRFLRIILPQALILALRPLGNELIILTKSSAIASLITIYDIFGITKLIYSRTFNFQIYIWAAILYLIIVELIRRLVMLLERRLTKHLKN